jgi:hypothetical protein
MKSTVRQVRNHNSLKNEEAHLERVLVHVFKKRANFHSASKVSTPTQPSWMVLGIANVRLIILMKQDDDDTNQEEISDDYSGDRGKYTFSSDMEEDYFDNQQNVLHLGQARHDTTVQTTRVPLPKKWNHADTVIACSSLPNLQHPAGAIAPPLLKSQKSTINIVHE